MRIVVTDLTRFKNQRLLCMAGLTEDGMHCVRPLMQKSPHYFEYENLKKHNIRPGTILDGDFFQVPSISPPHSEDCNYKGKLHVSGEVDSATFKEILQKNSHTSLSSAFGCHVRANQKILTQAPNISIITLKLVPSNIQVVQDGFDSDKIKAHLVDDDGTTMTYLSITDLGFYDYVGASKTRRIGPSEATQFIHSQDSVYVRIGLSRKFTSEDGRSGYWMQVNGIYTFPDFMTTIRGY